MHDLAFAPPTLSPDRSVFRTTARVIGVVYLAGMVVGIGGNMLIQSILTGADPLASIAGNGSLIALGVILWLTTVAGDTAHGVLFFPILKRHSERMAVGYLATRIVDAVFIAVMALLILMQIPVGAAARAVGEGDPASLGTLSTILTRSNLYAYEIAMTSVGVAGLILCWGFYRTLLVPRIIAVWGLAGYAILLIGSLLQIIGLDLHSIHAIPGGLWELFIGIWLIVKGFSPLATVFGHRVLDPKDLTRSPA